MVAWHIFLEVAVAPSYDASWMHKVASHRIRVAYGSARLLLGIGWWEIL